MHCKLRETTLMRLYRTERLVCPYIPKADLAGQAEFNGRLAPSCRASGKGMTALTFQTGAHDFHPSACAPSSPKNDGSLSKP